MLEFWGTELCFLIYVERWYDASVCSWELCMAWHVVGGNVASFPLPCFHCTPLSLHPSKEDSSSPSLPSSHPLTRTSTAFLCPPKLNSTLMIQCFLPLPCLGAAVASQARSTGRGVGMAYGAGGDLAVLLHTAASKCQLSHLAIALALLRVPLVRTCMQAKS